DEAIYLGDYIVVMSARPGTIRLLLENHCAHPRDRADTDFATLRKRVFREFFAAPQTARPFVYSI
ncbi:MAG: hypothetical protein LBO79_00785, partial [Zoogloeaceae bacterium]|nr:hypothetical protein [Zoogloeaceae bacterium]